MVEGNKRGQIEMSFGMIFSIILIICFVAFAFYVIVNLLKTKSTSEVVIFVTDLQKKVDEFWTSSGGSDTSTFAIPSKVEKICFIDFTLAPSITPEIYDEFERLSKKTDNLIFYPKGSTKTFYSVEIKNIDLEKITATENPYCIPAKNGKVNLQIKKDFDEKLVTVIR